MFDLLNTLYVTTQGAVLNLDHDTVRVSVEGELRLRAPLLRLEAIVVFGNVTLTPFLIHRCAADGRHIAWLSTTGRFRARICGPTKGNVLLRRSQHTALDVPAWPARIARQLVAGKIQNSRLVLLRAAREYHDEPAAETLRHAAGRLELSLEQLRREDDLERIRGIEGDAARAYFSAFGYMVRVMPEAGLDFARSRRPPRDRLNALLGFLYALLREECVAGLESVGLDPQVGYLHSLRPGRPALALDLMEELRPIIADRLALTLLNRRQLPISAFEHLAHGSVQLTDSGRKTVIAAYQKRKETLVSHRLLKSKVPLGLVPHVQSRLLARHLRGDLPHYPPFLAR
jgi:CRISPR-associated protein Cas1